MEIKVKIDKGVYQRDIAQELGVHPKTIGNIPPAEFEEAYHRHREAPAMVVELKSLSFRKTRRGS